MKLIIFLAGCFIYNSTLFSQTTLTIIGTIHSGNSFINADNIYNRLQKLKPSTILLEYDSTIVINCNLIDSIENLKDNGGKRAVELSAAIKYKIKNASVCLIPYDIFIKDRDDFIDKLGNEYTIFMNSISKLAKKRKLNTVDLDKYKKFTNVLKLRNEALSQHDLDFINSDSCMLLVKNEDNLKKDIIEKFDYKLLNVQNSFKNAYLLFHKRRNEKIVDNVFNILKASNNTNVVVLCGLFHKIDLLAYLTPLQKKYNFIINAIME